MACVIALRALQFDDAAVDETLSRLTGASNVTGQSKEAR